MNTEDARRHKRRDRAAELIAHAAAAFVGEAASTEPMITVTRALASTRSDHVTVFVSVFPETGEQSAIAFLFRQRERFSDYLKTRAVLSPLPRVDFEIDVGEKNRRHLEELDRS